MPIKYCITFDCPHCGQSIISTGNPIIASQDGLGSFTCVHCQQPFWFKAIPGIIFKTATSLNEVLYGRDELDQTEKFDVVSENGSKRFIPCNDVQENI